MKIYSTTSLRDGLRKCQPSGRFILVPCHIAVTLSRKGQYYHLYNRGAGKGKIFFNPGNYEYLLQLVQRYRKKYSVAVIAYCLMPNHYHFLLRQETDVPLSIFMRVLFSSYVQALNVQHERTGALFEGRFKPKRIETWEYLMVLCRYIHLNPVKAKLVPKPEDWAYSNYREWMGMRESALVDKVFVQDHSSSAEAYAAFVSDAEDERRSFEKIRKYLID